jgi:3-oxoacyl-[acyl-carrier protein] reductase
MKKKSKDVLITGASGAIGSALAKRFALLGYSLHLTSRVTARLKDLVKDLRQGGTPVKVYRLELSNVKNGEQVIRQFFKAADNPVALICNAGNLGVVDRFQDAAFSAWSASIMENFVGQAAMIHAFARSFAKLKRKDGSIITLSGAGLGANTTFDRLSSYSTAKAALTHLVEALAPELGSIGITINAIAPGQVLSGITKQAIKAGAKAGPYAQSAKRCMENGGVSPELAADLIQFLVSPEAHGITGRLLSARFDAMALKQNAAAVAKDSNLYRLRRIDNDRFEVKPS